MSKLEDILRTVSEHDTFAAIDQIGREPDVLAAARIFVEVMRHFYWKQKNLAAAVMFGQAGATFGLTSAARVELSDAALANQLRGVAKGLMYDIASFTWPGWDEPGIAITATDLAFGMDAAKGNLRLARELNKGDLPLSRGHWMLAGHYLCAGNHAAAKQHYELGPKHSIAAKSKPDELLSIGFGKLTDLLAAPGSEMLRQELDVIERDLAALEHGADFVQQIQTALRVFTSKPPVAPQPLAPLS